MTLDLVKIPLEGSALPSLLVNGPPLKKLTLLSIDFKDADVGIFAGLAQHQTLETLDLNIKNLYKNPRDARNRKNRTEENKD